MNSFQPIQLFIAGDSTSASYTSDRVPLAGWGQMIGSYFQPGVIVRNAAVSGSSSMSFRDEGHLRRITEELQAGDYLFIQFGHNDEKEDPKRHTDPASSFPASLQIYLHAARSKMAFPVLLTPVERRSLTDDGKLASTHGLYADAVRQLASGQRVPLLDLCSASLDLFRNLGTERSKELFIWLKPGEYPAYPDGVEDNTHFCALGAKAIAGLVANLIRESQLELCHYLISTHLSARRL